MVVVPKTIGYPERIDNNLKSYKSWANWKWIIRSGECKKQIYSASGRYKPSEGIGLSSFDDAVAADPNFFGLYLQDYMRLIGIDVDECFFDGAIRDWAIEPIRFLLERKMGPIEVSPSGTGLKMLVEAKVPVGYKGTISHGEGKQGIEIKSKNSYWGMTGLHYAGVDSFPDRDVQTDIDEFFERFMEKAEVIEGYEFRELDLDRNRMESSCARNRKRIDAYVGRSMMPSKGRRWACFCMAQALRFKLVDASYDSIPDAEIRRIVHQWNESGPRPKNFHVVDVAITSALKGDGRPPAPDPLRDDWEDFDDKHYDTTQIDEFLRNL